MATRTTYDKLFRPTFVADNNDTRREGGQIDWANVPNAAPYLDERGFKMIKGGTLMNREDAANGTTNTRLLSPSEQAVANTSPAGVLVTDVFEDSDAKNLSGYGIYTSGSYYRQYLPEYADVGFQALFDALGARHTLVEISDTRGL